MEIDLYEFSDLNHIASRINRGMCAVVETDTVIGLVGKDANALYELKQRDLSKPLITFVNAPVQTTNAKARELMKRH